MEKQHTAMWDFCRSQEKQTSWHYDMPNNYRQLLGVFFSIKGIGNVFLNIDEIIFISHFLIGSLGEISKSCHTEVVDSGIFPSLLRECFFWNAVQPFLGRRPLIWFHTGIFILKVSCYHPTLPHTLSLRVCIHAFCSLQGSIHSWHCSFINCRLLILMFRVLD